MSYLLFMILCIGLRPSRVRSVRCSSADRHNIAGMLIRTMGPVKVLLVPSEEQRLVPTMELRALISWEGWTRRTEVTLHGG